MKLFDCGTVTGSSYWNGTPEAIFDVFEEAFPDWTSKKCKGGQLVLITLPTLRSISDCKDYFSKNCLNVNLVEVSSRSPRFETVDIYNHTIVFGSYDCINTGITIPNICGVIDTCMRFDYGEQTINKLSASKPLLSAMTRGPNLDKKFQDDVIPCKFSCIRLTSKAERG